LVVLRARPLEVAAEIVAEAPELSDVAQILDCPFVLFADDTHRPRRSYAGATTSTASTA